MTPIALFFDLVYVFAVTQLARYLAERCSAFVLIALGESVLDTGATFGDLGFSAAVITAFVVAFVLNVALWWVYFARSAEAASTIIAHSDDPGRLGRSAYTYFHLPMIAGIIVTAVGIERLIAHPTAGASFATTITLVSGPTLYLAGHFLFKWAFGGHFAWSHVGGVIILLLISLITRHAPLLMTSGIITATIAVVAGWDTYTHHTVPGVSPESRDEPVPNERYNQ